MGTQLWLLHAPDRWPTSQSLCPVSDPGWAVSEGAWAWHRSTWSICQGTMGLTHRMKDGTRPWLTPVPCEVSAQGPIYRPGGKAWMNA